VLRLGVYLSWEHELCNSVRVDCNDFLLTIFTLMNEGNLWFITFLIIFFNFIFIGRIVGFSSFVQFRIMLVMSLKNLEEYYVHMIWLTFCRIMIWFASQPSCFSWTLASLNPLTSQTSIFCVFNNNGKNYFKRKTTKKQTMTETLIVETETTTKQPFKGFSRRNCEFLFYRLKLELVFF
jgi:hypothetical protein